MSGAPATAGWVLADMLLVLVIIAFGVQLTSAAPAASPAPREPPEQPRRPPGMLPKPVKLVIRFDPEPLLSGRRPTVADVRRQIARGTRALRGRTAALVFVWGRAPEVGRGLAIANAVSRQVRPANPSLFRRALMRPYWSGDREGSAELEIYVFS